METESHVHMVDMFLRAAKHLEKSIVVTIDHKNVPYY